MTHELYRWIERIKAAEREFLVMRMAADRMLLSTSKVPTLLSRNMTMQHLRSATDHLEGTYIVRLFAEFETGLRSFWPTVKKSRTPNRTRDLLEGIDSSRQIPHDLLTNAHSVREYRNTLIHEREQPIVAIPVPRARGHLTKFFTYLPLRW